MTPSRTPLPRSHPLPPPGVAPPHGALIYSRKYPEALSALRQLGFPRPQQTGRAALTLLALLALIPDLPWRAATDPPCRISTLLAFAARHYGATMPPHARETVRRRCVRPFLAAGLVVANPDRPERPVNSPATVYQIAPAALALLRAFGTPSWAGQLAAYRATAAVRATHQARRRHGARIAVTLPTGRRLMLSPGGQNVLVKQVIEECCPRFAPGGRLLFVGDAGARFAHIDWDGWEAIGVALDVQGPVPDLAVHDGAADRLLLIEAVASHGPIDAQRRWELATVFGDAAAPLAFVTAFPGWRAMARYAGAIAPGTWVWVAEAPDRIIHFDGRHSTEDT
ncbi:MAG: BsuBI/PstI family type II restriction endonuclease [Thermomicrobiales bacterium]